MKLLNTLLFVGLLTTANAQITKVSENIIKDTKTNFLWQDSKETKTQKRNFEDSVEYCTNLEIDGEKNWKMPNFLALFSIVDPKVYNPTINKEFKHVSSDNYWSSKTFSHGMSGEAFVVNFLSGAFNRELMDDKFYVRCYKDLNK